MLIDYLPVGLNVLIAGAIAFAIIGLSHLIGPKAPSDAKLDTYECGVPLLQPSRIRFSIKFYLIAVLFVLFDIEVVFLYPWALTFKSLLANGPFIFFEMAAFLGLLGLGLVYVWRKGALDWE